jgi:uncharacterized protein (TIGR03435 family)
MPNGFVRRPWSANIECPAPFHCGISGNRFNEDVASLADLIMDAYRLRRYQVTNLPDWGDSGKDVYDIAAKFADDQTPTVAMARRMLQTLLADRFQLKFHHETKELPVYALVAGKGALKLTQGPEGPCEKGPGGGPSTKDPAVAFITSWDHIPELLTMFSGRPVLDKTGFAGHYCTLDGQEALFALDLRQFGGGRGRGNAPEAAPDADPGGASIFSEVQQKWGLKLESQKGPVDILVIDHVERPSGN